MKQCLIKVENLSLAISGKPILENIFLEIFEGECLSIIGPNGAGKSSLLKCLMRIFTHYQGSIRLKGEISSKMGQKKLAQHISYVPQSSDGIFPFSVKEYIMMGRYPYLSPFTTVNTEDKRIVKEAMALTGTTQFADRFMNTLSGGERQIVCIAAAVAQQSNMMLLDEPTTFLDPRHESEIYHILQRLNKELNMTIVSVTHDINNAVLHSHRAAVLKNGSFIFTGPAEDIMNNDVLQAAFGKSFVFCQHPQSQQNMIVPEVH